MRLATLLGPDLDLVLASDPEALRDALSDFHVEDIAEIVEDLDDDRALAIIRALPADLAADVIERLPSERQVTIFGDLEPSHVIELISEMDPDDRVDIVQELAPLEQEALLAELAKTEPEVAEELRELVAYGPDTAGGRMTTEFASAAPETKVWEAIDIVRRASRDGSAELLYYLYIVGFGKKLLGVVSLRELILADPGQTLADVMSTNIVRVTPHDDQEHVADVIARYDLHAVPVVDDNLAMLGIVTIDDVVDVVIQEATEDAQLMGGVTPLEDSYFATGVREFVWKRGTWLVLLFMGQLLTATVMQNNQHMIEVMVELVLFMPLIIASGGNAGSQSSSLIIRALAVGEVEPRDWLRVLTREVVVGALLGLGLGVLGFARAAFTGGDLDPIRLGSAVAMSIIAVVTLAAVVGAVLPMAIKRLGLDPAVSSTPFIASVTDVFGLMVYFTVAHAIFGSVLD